MLGLGDYVAFSIISYIYEYERVRYHIGLIMWRKNSREHKKWTIDIGLFAIIHVGHLKSYLSTTLGCLEFKNYNLHIRSATYLW